VPDDEQVAAQRTDPARRGGRSGRLAHRARGRGGALERIAARTRQSTRSDEAPDAPQGDNSGRATARAPARSNRSFDRRQSPGDRWSRSQRRLH
jgi:hypothetical protein